jgi:drug/metabolite transporter (DMT)-like permease
LGFIGLCILVKPSAATPDTHMEIWGKLVLIFAACSWAAGSIIARYIHSRGSSMLPMARQMISGGTVMCFLGLFHGDWFRLNLGTVSLTAWMGFSYLVIFGSLIGFTAYVWLMRISTPERVSTISYVNLVVAVLIGWTIGGEPMTLRIWIGAGIIIGSVVLVLKKKVAREVVTPAPPEA